jgi:hypothetical protein
VGMCQLALIIGVAKIIHLIAVTCESFEFSEFVSLYDFCSHRNFPRKLVYLETPKV